MTALPLCIWAKSWSWLKAKAVLNPHDYTKSLLAAIPVPDPKIESKKKRVLLEERTGEDKYNLEHSELVEVSEGHWVAMPTGA